MIIKYSIHKESFIETQPTPWFTIVHVFVHATTES